MNKQYQVHLTDPDVTQLQQLLRRGTHSARVQTRARILLLANAGQTDAAIAAALLTSTATVQRVRQRAVQEGVAAALAERPRPGRPPRLTGDGEARLTVLACTQPPRGRARWTIQLLTDRIALCEEVPAVSRETVRRRLHVQAIVSNRWYSTQNIGLESPLSIAYAVSYKEGQRDAHERGLCYA